jgi:hypothetical protein
MSEYSPQHPVLIHLDPCPSFSVKELVSYPYKTKGKHTVLHVLIFQVLPRRKEDKIL